MANLNSFYFLILSLSLALSACAKRGEEKSAPQPIVASMKQTYTSAAQENVSPVLLPDGTTQPAQPGKPAGALISEVTLSKAALLERVFNYSSSLQFSSVVDGKISTAMMGLSLGEVPASFQILDDKLRLLTDGSINFESDVNHPSRLILEFPILSQTADTLTIRADRASPILDTFLLGNKNKVPVRYSFLRSMEYVSADELFLIESTVELEGGTIGEFMESIRPRSGTVPADVKTILADATLNKDAARYRLLDAGDVYVNKAEHERIKTVAATRFLIKNGEPVKWYVTANIPDAYINDVKNAVEGWNRYSKASGQSDLVRFEGRLPQGIKIGDPRYNLIVWDTVQAAGAAYESQNADPATGIQSHSMIYIPYAWVNIGKAYWKQLAPETQAPGELRATALSKILKDRTFLGRSLPVNCMDSAELHISMESQQNPEQFARGLLKGVVFHEMGHAMGLAHNFKGSLSFDADDNKKIFSTSIMDYNHYNEEEAAFASLDSSDGPLLEYDRQLISVLYNEGKDIKDGDAKLPACADAEADSLVNGVDPLCNRYDIGSDITKEAGRALELFTKAGAKRGRMEAITPEKIANALLALPPAAEVKTPSDMKAALSMGLSAVSGTIGIYTASGANSFAYLGSQAMKSLKVFREGVLPEGYVESEMRERALAVLETSASMNEFPALTKEAVTVVKPKLLEYLSSTAFVASLPRDEQVKTITDLAKAIDKAMGNIETVNLANIRARLIAAVASTPTAPLAFIERNGTKMDIEPVVMGLLEQMSSEKAGNANRPLAERAAALKSLKSYSRSENYLLIAERVAASLALEIHNSTDALRKEGVRKLRVDFVKVE